MKTAVFQLSEDEQPRLRAVWGRPHEPASLWLDGVHLESFATTGALFRSPAPIPLPDGRLLEARAITGVLGIKLDLRIGGTPLPGSALHPLSILKGRLVPLQFNVALWSLGAVSLVLRALAPQQAFWALAIRSLPFLFFGVLIFGARVLILRGSIVGLRVAQVLALFQFLLFTMFFIWSARDFSAALSLTTTAVVLLVLLASTPLVIELRRLRAPRGPLPTAPARG